MHATANTRCRDRGAFAPGPDAFLSADPRGPSRPPTPPDNDARIAGHAGDDSAWLATARLRSRAAKTASPSRRHPRLPAFPVVARDAVPRGSELAAAVGGSGPP